MVTQLVAGRVFDFSRVVGRAAVSGIGFTQPVAVAIAAGDLVYVLSRGWEQISNVPWNRTQNGVRVGIVTIGDEPGDEEFIGEFSKRGDAPGELIWPTGLALDNLLAVWAPPLPFTLSTYLGTLDCGLGCFPFDNGAYPPLSHCRGTLCGIRSLVEFGKLSPPSSSSALPPQSNSRRCT